MAARAGDSRAVPCSRPHPRANINRELTLGLVQRTGHFRTTGMITLFDHHLLDKKRPDSAPMKISLATELKILETPPRASDFVRRTKYSVP
jgi:hypothetical protein